MSHCPLRIPGMVHPHPLSDLADSFSIEPRTIRSGVAQRLLLAALTRGPTARCPASALETQSGTPDGDRHDALAVDVSGSVGGDKIEAPRCWSSG